MFSKIGIKTLNALYIKKLLRPQEKKEESPSKHGRVLARLKILEQKKHLTKTMRNFMIRNTSASSSVKPPKPKQNRGKSIDFTHRVEKFLSVHSPAKTVRRIYGHFESAPLSCNTSRSYSPIKSRKGSSPTERTEERKEERSEVYFKTNGAVERANTNRDIKHLLDDENTLLFANETHLAPKMLPSPRKQYHTTTQLKSEPILHITELKFPE